VVGEVNFSTLQSAFTHRTYSKAIWDQETNMSVGTFAIPNRYEGISKRFRTGRLEWELQMAQLPATMCSCVAILWVSLVSSATITLCVASQPVFIVVRVYFVIDSVRKLLNTLSYDVIVITLRNRNKNLFIKVSFSVTLRHYYQCDTRTLLREFNTIILTLYPGDVLMLECVYGQKVAIPNKS
jgi:hypothetical protein